LIKTARRQSPPPDKGGKGGSAVNSASASQPGPRAAGGCGGGATATGGGGGCGGGTGGGCGGCGGGGAQIKKDAAETIAQVAGDTQIINAAYTASNFLQPNSFKVKAGTNVKFTIDVRDDGRGCGYAIMIRGLYNNAVPLTAGTPINMEFTPTTPGSYDITCSMGMINYGAIVVE